MILVTGGAGFIGSNFVLDWLEQSDESVVNFDKLTYAGNLDNLSTIKNDPRYKFVKGDICNTAHISQILTAYKPRAIIHFAAESHVDRSIRSPSDFVQTNINGTFSLLEAARDYWSGLSDVARSAFRFLNISTDEVYGSLGPNDAPFTEITPYSPNSPYSASKAAADHLVRAYHHTYGLPTLTSNCSNNYGPYHFPEKFIPLIITNALVGNSLPIYGDGKNIRDWLYVGDHCNAIRRVLAYGRPGEVYNIGGSNERSNLEVAQILCDILDYLIPKSAINGTGSYRDQITFVTDRPGHDRRYAVNVAKIERELGWKAIESFESGMKKTVQWFLENRDRLMVPKEISHKDHGDRIGG